MADDGSESSSQELARLRADEQKQLDAIQLEQEARTSGQLNMDQAERDHDDLIRLREANRQRVIHENSIREYEAWQQNQHQLRQNDEQERLLQEENDMLDQRNLARTNRGLARSSDNLLQDNQNRPSRGRFSNQFESTVNDAGNHNLNASLMQMTQELSKNSSIWSHATLRCNPCTPSSSSDIITRYDFDLWKSEWFSLLDTAPLLTEKQKMSLFMRSSGTHLREILTGLSIDSPDESASSTPYSDMMARLEKHFNSEANQKLEAMIFRSTSQLQGESNVDFIRRLLKKVKFCGFTNLMFELIATVAQNTSDPRLRLKALDPECDYSKLMTYATTLQLNANIEKVKESNNIKQIEVNAVNSTRPSFGSPYSMPPGNSNWNKAARDPSRAQDKTGNRFKQQAGGRPRQCYRCGNDLSSHPINNCPAFNKYCSHCNKKGHVSKVCKSKAAGFPAVKKEITSSPNDAKKAKIMELSTTSLDQTSEVSFDDDIIYE